MSGAVVAVLAALVAAASGPTRTSVATENFNRAGPALGANWTNLNSTWADCQISASTVVAASASNGANEAAAVWVGTGSFTNDHYAEITIGGLSFLNDDFAMRLGLSTPDR